MSNIADAARRSAYRLKEGAWPHLDDLLTLLPVLDAVGAGREDPDKLELWARAIARAAGKLDSRWEWYVAEARAAIALADAEGAAA